MAKKDSLRIVGEAPEMRPEAEKPAPATYAFTALEFMDVRDAIGRMPMGNRAQKRWLDELDDLFVLSPEEKERVGYVSSAPIITEQGLQENWGLRQPGQIVERVLREEHIAQLRRTLTLHEVQGWRKRFYDLRIASIIEKLGGELEVEA